MPLAIDDDLEVHMAPRGVAGGPGQGDDLALDNKLAYSDEQERIVAVPGLHLMPVVNGDALARMPGPARDDHPARLAGAHGRTAGNWIILADMDLAAEPGRIEPPTVRAGNPAGGHWVLQKQTRAQHCRTNALVGS